MAASSIFRDVLRLLTTEEVEELTTVTEVEDMHSLTKLVQEYLCSLYTPPSVQKLSLVDATADVLPDPTTASPASAATGEKISGKTIAEFIFQEKEKFKKFNQQNKKKKSLEIYRHTLANGHHRASPTQDSDASSTVGTGKGTLVNRRVG